MFDTINGLPIHPLVVHGIVVLLPLGIVGTMAIAVRPAWRRPYGALVVGANAMATVLIPIAIQSGKKLETHVGTPGKHAQLGRELLWFAIPLLVFTAALVYLDRAVGKAAGPGSSISVRTLTAVASFAVLAGIAAGVQVYRVGDSGARAAWAARVQNTIPSTAN